MNICYRLSMFLGTVALFACGVSGARAQEYSAGPAFSSVPEGFYTDETPGFTTDSLLREAWPTEPSPPLPSWGQIDAEVFKQVRETDLSQLARAQAQTKPPRDPARLMARLDLFVRVGDRRRAKCTIEALGHTDLARDSVQANKIGNFLIDHRDWELTQRFLEVCPRAEPFLTAEFIAQRTQETSPQRMERWLDARERESPNHDYWRMLSDRHFASLGTYKRHRVRLAAEIRAHPNDLSRVLPYLPLHIPSYFPLQQNRSSASPIDWLPSVCRFDLAIENLAMGLELRDAPVVACPFLERALNLPITPADLRWLNARQYYLPRTEQGKPVPEAIHRYIKTALAKCYKAAGQWSDAQALEAEIAAQTPLKAGWSPVQKDPPGRWAAWRGNGLTGSPVAEPTSETDFRTWMARGYAHLQRKEQEQAGQAFRKALELTAAHPGAESQDRIRAMESYVYFLGFGTPATTAITDWLRSELEKTPPDGEYARALVKRAIRIPRNAPEFHLLEEPLWRYLAERKTWRPEEDDVLYRLEPYTPKEAQEAFLARMAQLTAGDPDKERQWGSLLERSGALKAAFPLLQDVARQTQNTADRRSAARLGLTIALQDNDWPQARAFWVEARHGLLESNSVRFHQGLLELAIQHKAREDAFDLFADWMRDDYNIFRGRNAAYPYAAYGYAGRERISFIKDLLDLGLRKRLQRLFHAMALTYPESHAPQDGLLALQVSPPSESTYKEHKLFSLHLNHQDLLSALRHVCEHDHVPYIFCQDGWRSLKVTLDLRNVTYYQAIDRILATASPSPFQQTRWYDGVLVLYPRRVSSAPATPGVLPLRTRLNTRVSAHLYGMDLDHALSLLRSSLGIDYHTKQSDEKREEAIQIDLTSVSVSRVLEGLLKQNPHLTTSWFRGDELWIGLLDDAPELE
jgi:tetratricopeptide (TPR) repeat protein